MAASGFSAILSPYGKYLHIVDQKKGLFMRLKKILAAGLATAVLAACAAPAISALEPHGTGIKMRNWLTNDPNYEFSDAYKTSVWYENFTSLEFSENERNTVLRIAISQLGYHEGDSAADFDGMNMSGSSNYIEYARLLVPHYNDNHYEWCACFVNWCLNQAHIDYASSEIGCWKWVGELKGMKMWQDSAAYKGTYTPKPADMIFFNWDGKNTGSGHIGYVLYTTDTHVYTIEGNADNNVTIRSYKLNDPCVIGYGTPPYDEGEEETIDFSYASGRPRGYYVVNNMNARLKDEDGKSICKVPVGSCVELRAVEDGNAKVIFDEQEGYLPESILVLMTPMQGVDTVTFDANGGENAPASQEIVIGEVGTVTADTPTLAGDTFLGWALRPFDMAPVYQPGDPITTTGDITLYAIWQNHSKTLADAAMAEGTLVRFPIPEATNHNAAIILGGIDPALMTPQNGTTVSVVNDETYGKVMSFVAPGACSDPYVTLPYAALMRSAQLAPVNATDVKYVVLLVNNVSLSNRAFDLFYTCDENETSAANDQTARVVSSTVAKDAGWQYVVFDMSEAKGWNGELQSLRLDYERAALDAGETLLLQGVYLLSNDQELEGLKEGIYFFPEQEKLPPEETTSEDIPVVAPGEDTSDHITDGTTGAETPAGSETDRGDDPGCVSAALASAWMMLAPAAWVFLRKRRED